MGAIAGAFGVPNAAMMTMRLLQGMQHRGQDAAGIAASHDGTIRDVRGIGLVDEVFAKVDFATALPGDAAIGRLRRVGSTVSDAAARTQPFIATYMDTDIALAHSGRLTDATLRELLKTDGTIFSTTDDAETMLHLMARAPGESLIDRFLATTPYLRGAWTVACMGAGSLFLAVDPYGYRPLMMAKHGDGLVFASETCALDMLSLRGWRAVEPGTAVIAKPGEDIRFERFAERPVRRRCSFEHIYFSRPDSHAFGMDSYAVREQLGMRLAQEETVVPDMVLDVPDSSSVMAASYADALGVKHRPGLIRNHYAGRTRTSTMQRATELGVRLKLGVATRPVSGKRLAVIDDSAVRGSTGRKLTELLHWAGAREVHLRFASPMCLEPCPYGVGEDARERLIAANMTVEQIRRQIGATTVRFLKADDLHDALGPRSRDEYCTECFGGPKEPPETDEPLERLRRT